MAIKYLIFAFIVIAEFVACSGVGFQTLASKSSLLSSTSVMTTPGDSTGQVVQPGNGNNSTGQVTQPGSGDNGVNGMLTQPGVPYTPNSNNTTGIVYQPTSPQPQPQPVVSPTSPPATFLTSGGTSVPVNLFCSSYLAAPPAGEFAPYTTFDEAVMENLPVELYVNNQLCSTNTAAIQNAIQGGTLTVASLQAMCPSLVSGQLQVSLSINGTNMETSAYETQYPSTFNVLWDVSQEPGSHPVPSTPAMMAECTTVSSPLVIRLPQDPKNPQPLNLSSAHSILFDLLGASANHRKVKIDWFTNLDYRFLVLPDAAGKVIGIDQLFGNNTTGPDGHGAANGYAALAKYDGMSADGKTRLAPADGIIDANDPIYPHLRVWLDSNFDGIAQPEELKTLAEVNITSIDLQYSGSFPEIDADGNQTTMKSVVQMSTGALDLIFDLWFAYKTP